MSARKSLTFRNVAEQRQLLQSNRRAFLEKSREFLVQVEDLIRINADLAQRGKSRETLYEELRILQGIAHSAEEILAIAKLPSSDHSVLHPVRKAILLRRALRAFTNGVYEHSFWQLRNLKPPGVTISEDDEEIRISTKKS